MQIANKIDSFGECRNAIAAVGAYMWEHQFPSLSSDWYVRKVSSNRLLYQVSTTMHAILIGPHSILQFILMGGKRKGERTLSAPASSKYRISARRTDALPATAESLGLCREETSMSLPVVMVSLNFFESTKHCIVTPFQHLSSTMYRRKESGRLPARPSLGASATMHATLELLSHLTIV